MKKNEQGFGVVEILLLIVTVGLIGGLFWYVWQAKNDDSFNIPQSITTQPQAKKTETTATPAAVDPAAKWLKYTSQNKKYSVAIPDGWSLSSLKSDDSIYAWDAKNINFTDGKQASVSIVNGGRDGSSMAFSLVYEDGNSKLGVPLSPDLKKVKTYTTANGVTVDKSSRTQTETTEMIDIPKGAKEFTYDLVSGNKKIQIVHDILPGEADQTQRIEQLIESLKFL